MSISDEVFRKADRLARRLRISKSELYTKALDAFVRTMDDREMRDALDRVYTAEPSELDPVLERLQDETLGQGGW